MEIGRLLPGLHRDGKGGGGAPGRSRTCGLKIRSLVLYPTELRARDGAGISADCAGAKPAS